MKLAKHGFPERVPPKYPVEGYYRSEPALGERRHAGACGCQRPRNHPERRTIGWNSKMIRTDIDDPSNLGRNPALARIAADEVALGMIVRLARTGEIARYAAMTGHDFVFIDMQHAAYTIETVSEIAQCALGCGVSAMVRVRGVDDPNIGVLLDCGVTRADLSQYRPLPSRRGRRFRLPSLRRSATVRSQAPIRTSTSGSCRLT